MEQKIWDRVFNKNVLDVAFNDTRVVVTDPIYNVPAIKDLSIEILFEQYGFHSVAKTSCEFFLFSFLQFINGISPIKEFFCLGLKE